MVYVLNNLGQPLMPTNRYAKIRTLLKKQMAKVVNTKPFTVALKEVKKVSKIELLKPYKFMKGIVSF